MKYLSDFKKISETKWQPASIHHMPFDEKYGLHKTQSELETEGILVDIIPEPQVVEGKIISGMFINPNTKEIWYEYIEASLTEEEKREQRLQALEVAMANMLGM